MGKNSARGRSRRSRLALAVAAALIGGLLAVVSASPAASVGPIVYVDIAAAGANDGSSWVDAFTDLQDALAVAMFGDEIWVAEGTYRPHVSDPGVSFELVDGVALVGGFATGGAGGSDPAAHPTVLSGDLAGDDLPGGVNTGDNSRTIVETGRIDVDPDGDSVLEGFTITGASYRAVWAEWWGLEIVNSRIVGNRSTFRGAGIYVREAWVHLVGSVVAHNSTSGAGAGVSVSEGPLLLTDSVVEYNTAGTFGGGVSFYGDGTGPLWLTRSRISNNSAGLNGGGVKVDTDSRAFVVDSEISHNAAGGDGGGIWSEDTLRVVNSVVAHNTAGGDGAGILADRNNKVSVVNSLVTSNSALGRGGGVFGPVSVVGSVVADNAADLGSGGQIEVGSSSGQVSVVNSILWPGVGLSYDALSETAVDYSNVAGWTGGGVGNIDVDPQFVGPGNYRLQATSPAREAGDNTAVVPDTYDVDDDGNTTEPTPDLDGRNRISGIVDMGAYEMPLPTLTAGVGVANPEGDTGSQIINVPVTLSAPSAVPVTVDWATLDVPGQSAVAHPGADYVAANGTLTFLPGETTKQVPIEVLGDTVDEPPLLYGEWGLVQLMNPSFATVDPGGLFGLGIFVIVDDDVTSEYELRSGPNGGGAPLDGATYALTDTIENVHLDYVSGDVIVEGVGVNWFIDEVLFRDQDLTSPYVISNELPALPIRTPFLGEGTTGSANQFLLGPGQHTIRAEGAYGGGAKSFVAAFTITP